MEQETASFRMPAEWEPHRATWIAWPHLESDFPGKLDAVRWAFCEFIRHVSTTECVEILCASENLEADLRMRLDRGSLMRPTIRIHRVPYDRSWLRDSAATFVTDRGEKRWVKWRFNAWAKYDDYGDDAGIPAAISKITKIAVSEARRPDTNFPLVLEGGAFDVDGRGSVMVTEECLLSSDQARNPGLTKEGYEAAFQQYLGATRTIWLKAGCEGDDTHGHIDDIARFVAPGVVVINAPREQDTENYAGFRENLSILEAARDASGSKLTVIQIPASDPIYCDDARLPASYMNFYFANDLVLVPTFNDGNDRTALGILAELLPQRKVIGIHCGDWILGYGSLHCSTQQEPK